MRSRALVPVLMFLAVLSVAAFMLARGCARSPDPRPKKEQQPVEPKAAVSQLEEDYRGGQGEGQGADNRDGAEANPESDSDAERVDAASDSIAAPVQVGPAGMAGDAAAPSPPDDDSVSGGTTASVAAVNEDTSGVPEAQTAGAPTAKPDGTGASSATPNALRGSDTKELNSTLRVAGAAEILAGTATFESSTDGAAGGQDRVGDELVKAGTQAEPGVAALPAEGPICQPVFAARLDSRAKRGLGASADTEASVEVALDWLAARQNTDGSWTVDWLDVPYSSGPTGLVLLTFLGAGVTHVSPHKHQPVAARSVAWLLASACDSASPGSFKQRTFYEQLLASAAVCEAFGMTGDRRLRLLADEAVTLVFARQGVNGGFGYAGPGADVHVTGLATALARSAAAAGVAVPADASKRLRAFWRDAVNSDGTAGYIAGGAPGTAASARTALGCLALSLTNGPADRLAASRRALSASGPQAKDFFQLWYGTDALQPAGDAPWEHWSGEAMPRLLRDQRPDGSWSGRYGQTISTALAVLTLEGFYRYARAPSAAGSARPKGG